MEMSKRCDADGISKVKNVYVEHGWPGENYKKEECLKKAEEVWESVVFGDD